MASSLGVAVREVTKVLLLVAFVVGALTFLIGLGLLGLAHLTGRAAPSWAELVRDLGALAMAFCAVGEGVLYAIGQLAWWPAPSQRDTESAHTPKDAA